MKNLVLVGFQKPVFRTLQGEGIHVGTDSIFLRLWGCDQSCDWCDTKQSWKLNSPRKEYSTDDVVKLICDCGPCSDLVVTGGNPLLQADALEELFEKFLDAPTGISRITIETNAYTYVDVPEAPDAQIFLSLSPKLHQYNREVIYRLLHTPYDKQLKLVVTGDSDDQEYPIIADITSLMDNTVIDAGCPIIIQPEFTRMRLRPKSSVAFARYVQNRLRVCGLDSRVIPQVHKFLGVE